MKTLITLSIAAITALFIGCGSGGGSSSATGTSTSSTTASTSSSAKTIKGHLVDAPVEGIFYSCGGPNSRGFTDNTGLFVCESSPIEFYIGKLSLGIVKIPTADGNVYPQDMVGAERSDFADADVVKMAQLLQSLDDDTLPSNGIKITQTVMDKYTTGMQFSTKSLNELLALAGVSEIDATSAMQHLQDTMGYSVSSQSSSSSSSSISSAQSSSTASVTDGQSIDSADLAGYTIVSEYKSGTKVKDVKKISYIFLPNNESITVFELFSGAIKVAHGTYNDSNGNNVAILNPTFDNNEDFIPAFGISSPSDVDKITVGESIALYPVTAIVTNDNNSIDESTVASTAVEEPEENTDAPMYDELYGKSLSIYNGISADLLNGMNYTFEYAGNTRYDSNVELHCTDYGYTDVFTEGTENGVTSKTYMFPGNSNIMCFESNYTAGAANSGPLNVVWYKE
jgi:hypothetical protein